MTINLLPTPAIKNTQPFFYGISLLILACLISFGFQFLFSTKIKQQQQQIFKLQRQHALLSNHYKKINKNSKTVLAQHSLFNPASLLNQLAQNTPSSIYLSKLVKQNQNIILTGVALNYADLFIFLKTIKNLFNDSVVSIKMELKEQQIQFVIMCARTSLLPLAGEGSRMG